MHSELSRDAGNTHEQFERWAADLARIRAVCRRKRIIGRPDPLIEAGCAALEARLAEMREVAR